VFDFIDFRIVDIIDILFLSVFAFLVLRIFRGTRAGFMIIGIGGFLLVALLAYILDLAGTKFLFGGLKTIGLVAFVIIFQPEIRRLLSSFGRMPVIGKRDTEKSSQQEVIEILVKSSFSLRDRGYGALIVIQGKIGLTEYTEKALYIGAKVSEPLFLSIFSPLSPLHDGACVVVRDRIEYARCMLPLSDSPHIEPSLGTRHRAAIGISEQSDCFVIIVSEERREVSFAYQGRLIKRITRETLRRNLELFFERTI
jgi:diadenylate cyclase